MTVQSIDRSQDSAQQRIAIVEAAKQELRAIEAMMTAARQNIDRSFELLRKVRSPFPSLTEV